MHNPRVINDCGMSYVHVIIMVNIHSSEVWSAQVGHCLVHKCEQAVSKL